VIQDSAGGGADRLRRPEQVGEQLFRCEERPQVVEGSWDREKVVLMSFPDESEFRLWSESAEYQEISKDRDAGADTVVLLVKGLA